MPRYFPDLASFLALAQQADVIPVFRQLLSDHLTPVTAFELLGRGDHALLLESVVGNEKIGRYSFIAASPSLVYRVKDGRAAIERPGAGSAAGRAVGCASAHAPGAVGCASAHAPGAVGCASAHAPGSIQEFTTQDPLADLSKLLGEKRYYRDKNLPALTGGLIGFAGYDTIRYYEGEKLPHAPADDRGLPDLLLGLYQTLVIFDNVDKTIKVVANADVSNTDPNQAYRAACAQIDELVTRLQEPPRAKLGEIDTRGELTLPFVSNMTQPQFEHAVNQAKEYIRAGDIFQVVPSQRLRVRSAAQPFDVYRALRVINPSPFMFYLKSPSCTLIGASPEILCRVQDRLVTSRPLAGTRRRGTTDDEDRRLEQELLADPKERAEHIMLVDLHRNDIGRVAKIGSVKVSDMMTVERYSHVMHITTNVTGQLDETMTALDALRVSLPVGTVSGAPKIRAMQIIDELEPTRRGPYGGAVGYLDFAGNMDMCIALRTIVWKDGIYDVQAGAGVVADSVPANEYEETMNKAKAMLKAVEIAQGGF
jgi:anthranilate synthase component 1